MPPYALLALTAAIGYSVGSLFYKQAMYNGSGLFRVTAFLMWAVVLVTAPFGFLPAPELPTHLWYQPLVAGFLFLSGQLLFVWALRSGDLSIVGPVAGAKPILNALLVSVLLGVSVPSKTWLACLLSAVALIILRSRNASTTHTFLRTATITLASAFSFALCDTCFQEWAQHWGPIRFSALTFASAGLGACIYIPFFGTSWKDLSRPARKHLLLGAFFCALPPLLMGYALGRYGHAPEVNVIYATRAILSIAVVRFLGPWVGSREQDVSAAVLWRRLLGAAILLMAVLLVLWPAMR